MELEFHRLELRYEGLRKRSPRTERQLLGSLSEVGQLLPIVVVAGGAEGRHIVVDGYKRIRALRRLSADTVRAMVWEMDEAEALLLERLMRTADSEGALEQGWLLRELQERFGMSLWELARRFDKTASWVSRRLALVRDLPEAIQAQVRSGAIGAHAAMKYLVPLARANVEDCLRLATAIAAAPLSTRQVGELYGGWLAGSEKTRELLLCDPALYLRAQAEARLPEEAKSPAQQLVDDLGALGGVARRAHRRLGTGLAGKLLPPERDEVRRCFRQAKQDAEALFRRWKKEMCDARPEHADGDPQAP
jgi:ParB/RepB/Spo0J family partition protein